jgi:hypothetical protein
VKKTLLSALAVAILLGTAGVGLAQQELKPVVVVSLSGYDELIGDVKFLGELGGNPELAKGLEGMLTMMTGGKGLAGLDKAKPWGAVVQTDGENFPILAFIPVSDLKAFLAVLPLPGSDGPPKPGADGIYELPAGGQQIFVAEKGGWAFLSNKKDDLAKAPADPAKLLGGMNEKYDVAVNVSIKNVPESVRQMIVGLLQMGAQAGLQQEPGESDEQFALRSKLTQQSLQQTIRTINEMDSILIGWAIDQKSKKMVLDFTATAVAGSETAKNMAQLSEAKTDFAGLMLPDAAITARFTGAMSASDVTQMKSTMTSIRATAVKELGNQGLPAEQEKKARQLLSDLLDLIDETIDAKTMDTGLAVRLTPDAATLVAGGFVANGPKLEKLVKEIAEIAKQEQPDVAPLLKLDAEQFEGVNLHLATLPLPADDPGAKKLAKLVGDKLEVAVGIGPKAAYVGMGRDAVKTVKEVITKNKSEAGKAVTPLAISASGAAIAKFLAASADEEEVQKMAAMIGTLLAQSEGKDHVTITSKPIPNGVTTRIELEEGILKVIGTLSKMVPGGGMAGPGF